MSEHAGYTATGRTGGRLQEKISTQDTDTNEARLDRLDRLVQRVFGLPPPPPGLSHAVALRQRDEAIRHLHALLNSQNTATRAREAEKAARDWLGSIGSETS